MDVIDPLDKPKMRKAKVIGYELAKWGDYPTLDGESGQEIPGYAYIVQSEEEAQKLAYYVTNAYKAASCLIYFVDKKSLPKHKGRRSCMPGMQRPC
ncbi:hypothetical protein N7494_004983 [Penicillium frequentans]|uniref:Gamma-glutamylcyclotransferase AIG2-like domain-containing protein n=1 Tax=Penicillium frequentans TaxID=3151616 RepID=A0AAD6D1R3_9EURO|nr:hypothetical protein N7494_004983 [Penicillium glabrum]